MVTHLSPSYDVCHSIRVVLLLAKGMACVFHDCDMIIWVLGILLEEGTHGLLGIV